MALLLLLVALGARCFADDVDVLLQVLNETGAACVVGVCVVSFGVGLCVVQFSNPRPPAPQSASRRRASAFTTRC